MTRSLRAPMGRAQNSPASPRRIGVANKVPFDVWQHIADFLPREILITLGLVNRHFCLIANKARYENVVISRFDKRIKKLCQDLRESDTRCGRLVRRFQVDPWFVEPQFGLEFGLLPPPSKKQKPLQRLLSSVSECLNPDLVQVRIQNQVKKRVQKGIKYITKAVRGMKELHEFKVTWAEDNPYHPELYRALLGPILDVIGPRLVVLKLNVPTEMLRHLYLIALPRLEHLEVDICTLDLSKREIDESFEGFIVFVNNLLNTLETLSIASRVPSRHLDLGKFFTLLGVFPRLHTFSLSIPFDGVHLCDPRHLNAFLAKHVKHLRNLRLAARRCGTVDVPSERATKYWVPNILSGNLFPELDSVQIALRPLKADMTPIHKFLAMHAINLTSLSLTDRPLELGEVRDILDCVGADELSCTRLAELKMRVRRLTPGLLKLIAMRLPDLKVLELTFDEIKATASHVAGNGTPIRNPKGEVTLFQQAIKDNRHWYAQWNLVTLGLSQGRMDQWLKELSPLFMEYIPALRDVIELPAIPLY